MEEDTHEQLRKATECQCLLELRMSQAFSSLESHTCIEVLQILCLLLWLMHTSEKATYVCFSCLYWCLKRQEIVGVDTSNSTLVTNILGGKLQSISRQFFRKLYVHLLIPALSHLGYSEYQQCCVFVNMYCINEVQRGQLGNNKCVIINADTGVPINIISSCLAYFFVKVCKSTL